MLNETVLVMWMFGLMTHVGNDKIGGPDVKRALAIVADDQGMNHQPIMGIIDRLDTNNPRFWPYTFEKGDKVTFEDGVTAGGALATSDFEHYVPSLSEPFTNSLLHEPIKQTQRHDDVVAWIHYPKGELDIFKYKPNEGRFSRGSDFVRSQCVPMSTVFVAPTHSCDEAGVNCVNMYITHHDGSRTPFRLEGDILLIVLNQPMVTPGDDDAALHFANYGDLLERRFGVIPRRLASVEEGNPCTRPGTVAAGTKIGALLTELLATRNLSAIDTDTSRQKRFSTGPAFSSKTTTLGLDTLLETRAAEHPSCTNTDWP